MNMFGLGLASPHIFRFAGEHFTVTEMSFHGWRMPQFDMTNVNDYIAENQIVIYGQSHHCFVVTKVRRCTMILSLVTILQISRLPDRHCFQETELVLVREYYLYGLYNTVLFNNK